MPHGCCRPNLVRTANGSSALQEIIPRKHGRRRQVGLYLARIWDAETGQLLVEPFRQRARIRMAQFSPDGKRIITAPDDNTATVLDIEIRPTFSESLTARRGRPGRTFQSGW